MVTAPANTLGGLTINAGSKYAPENQPAPPPNTITDVDLSRNWFSPFQPITPFGPPYVTYPREWDYPVGANLDYIPARIQLMQQLRGMSETWGVLRTVIETRKDQLLRQPWEIQVKGKPRAQSKELLDCRQRFRKPDGKRRYNAWARLLLEDLFVIDAPTLYIGDRDRAGRPMYFQVINGDMIKPLIDDAGRTPDYPNPAYQLIVKGLPMDNFTERDLIYTPMRPRTNLPIYGYSPVEQIYIEVTEAIKKTMYQLNYWTEGNIPDMIMSVPENWTSNQIASFQALFDANLAGNLGEKSKIRFVPHGMNPYDIKASGGRELHSDRDESLIRLVCYAFSTSPTPFIRAMNRATAQTSNEQAEEEGLFPLMSWWKEDIMDRLIQDELGYDDLEFVWLPVKDPDQLKQSQVDVNYIKVGAVTINEVRDNLGKPPVEGGDDILVYTNNGVLTLQDAKAAGKAEAMQSKVPGQDDVQPTPSPPSDGSQGAGGHAKTAPEKGGGPR